MQLGLMAASGAALTMAWGHLKGLGSRLISFFIVTCTIESDLVHAFMGHCWKNYRRAPWGLRRFDANEWYVRPLDRVAFVGFERPGQAMTFFQGWRPLFLSVSENRDGGLSSAVTVSYLRGSFSIDKILKEALTALNDQLHEAQGDRKRFYINRVFGRSSSDEDSERAQKGAIAESSKSTRFLNGTQPIQWKLSDLGAPIEPEPFSALAYSPEILTMLQEIRDWMGSEKWFRSKKLPWRYSAGLEGGPGNGKSSFVRAVGQELDLPIHMYDLSSLSNEELVRAWKHSLSVAPVIVLMEDLDRVFDGDKAINKQQNNKQSLSFDCLLNCISGVERADGILLFITANHMDRLDTALGVPDRVTGKSSRPGRIDKTIHFGPPSEEGRFEIARRILSDFQEIIPETVFAGHGESGAQFEQRCGVLAAEEYWKRLRQGKPVAALDRVAPRTSPMLSSPQPLKSIEPQGTYR